MKIINKLSIVSVMVLLCHLSVANEGMWQPHQLPEMSETLAKMGLKIPAEEISSLTQFPMNAIISLGGCTASFVSDQGLVVTNHHCAYGSIQYNSTVENNLLANGFLAKKLKEELPAAPGSRVYVTESLINVSDKILGDIDAKLQGRQRYQIIEDKIKTQVAACEAAVGYRCEIYTYHGGLEYYLIKKLAIRDVRLVYAPAASIGKFGGDTDNWMWPRHTGDWSFYRAYVGKDGMPADYSEENIPYRPKSHLKVSAKGVQENDFVMVTGYPGKTNRYSTIEEVTNTFEWAYPTAKRYREEYIDTIYAAAAEGSDARIKYESIVAGLANYAKNYGSMIASYNKGDMLQRKRNQRTQLQQWINADQQRQKKYGNVVENLAALMTRQQQNKRRKLIMGYMARTAMMSVADSLLRLAHEKQLPDAQREPGYQERDMTLFVQNVQSINRRYDAKVDAAVMLKFLEEYASFEASERVPAFDEFFALTNGFYKKAVQATLDRMHTSTQLGDKKIRLEWMKKSVQDFEASNDLYIKLAVAMYSHKMQVEAQEKALTGELQKARPAYMDAVISYNKSIQKPIYADANSSLRVSYGKVTGYSPQDGLQATAFTALEGLANKHVKGDNEFDVPEKLLNTIKEKDYASYAPKWLGSVPVNFLSTLDITGGNSGSPVLNGKAELVGLLFDGVYESIIGDWDYDEKLNRAIQVDSRYMLWVMDKVDGAHNLLNEMNISR